MWIPSGMRFKNLLFIGRRVPAADDEVFNHFQHSRLIDTISNPYSRQLGDKIIYYENIDSTGLRLAIEGLQEMKNQFSRN